MHGPSVTPSVGQRRVDWHGQRCGQRRMGLQLGKLCFERTQTREGGVELRVALECWSAAWGPVQARRMTTWTACVQVEINSTCAAPVVQGPVELAPSGVCAVVCWFAQRDAWRWAWQQRTSAALRLHMSGWILAPPAARWFVQHGVWRSQRPSGWLYAQAAAAHPLRSCDHLVMVGRLSVFGQLRCLCMP